MKRPAKKKMVPKPAATPKPSGGDAAPDNKKHKEDFEQLLDDAVLGVKRK